MFGSKKSSSENNLLPKDLLNGLVKASDPMERVLIQEDKKRWDRGKPSTNVGGYNMMDRSFSDSISVSGTVSPSYAPSVAAQQYR